MVTTIESVPLLDSIIDNIVIYGGSAIFLIGMIGNVLNILIFTSLKFFRENTCGLCLLLLSASDCGILIFHTLQNVILHMSNENGNVNGRFSCKTRLASAEIFGLLSHTIICLAAIDQLMSTSMPQRHQGINFKIMRLLITTAVIFSFLHGLPMLILSDVVVLPATNTTLCRIINDNVAFSNYTFYISIPFIDVLLPVTIMSITGLFALRNVRSMDKTKVNPIRLRREQQLTMMVLTKIVSTCVTVIPFITVFMVLYTIAAKSDNIVLQKQVWLVYRICTMLFYANFAVSEYNGRNFI